MSNVQYPISNFAIGYSTLDIYICPMNWLTSPETWIALLTLTVLEIVLGIDNIIFISILAGKLPAGEQPRARTMGLTLAMVTRILLLLSLTGIMRLTLPLFSPFGHPFSGRDLILLLGGLFLIWKSTREIHDKLEGEEGRQNVKAGATFGGVIVQIALLDIVFSRSEEHTSELQSHSDLVCRLLLEKKKKKKK